MKANYEVRKKSISFFFQGISWYFTYILKDFICRTNIREILGNVNML